jgi:hypothetical protein
VKKLIFTLIVTIAAVGGAVAFTIQHDEPPKANAVVGIDPSLIMNHAGSLPVAHYDDYSLVFNWALGSGDSNWRWSRPVGTAAAVVTPLAAWAA